MKELQLRSLAKGFCQHLSGRNYEIQGCWGIGFLCAHSIKTNTPEITFKIYPGQDINIAGFDVVRSKRNVDKLSKFGISSIEGSFTFEESGIYPILATPKYNCAIKISFNLDGNPFKFNESSYAQCWAQDKPQTMEYMNLLRHQSWKKMSKDLVHTINTTFKKAHKRRYEVVTAEQLLLSLLDNPSALELIQHFGGWPDLLRARLTKHIRENTRRVDEAVYLNPMSSHEFAYLAYNAVAYSFKFSGSNHALGVDMVASILRLKNSYAVELLNTQNITHEKVLHLLETSQSKVTG